MLGPANERREALRIVREGLEWVHSLFEEIGPKPMVPVRIPNKPDAAIEYFRLIDFERADFEEFPFEGVRCKVRELLTKLGDSPRVFKTVNDYLKKLYDDEELSSAATIRKFRIVQTEGNRQVARLVEPYRRKTILSVGYRVRSRRGIPFRRWSTNQLQKHPCQ